jgi:Fe2+ transport system protein B
MAMILLYIPCVAVLGVIRRETNSWRWALFTFGYTLALGWVAATLIYQIGRLFVGG